MNEFFNKIFVFFFLFRHQNRTRDPARYHDSEFRSLDRRFIIGRINCVQVHCDA